MKKERKILVQFRSDKQVLSCLDAIAQIRETTRSDLIRKTLKKFVIETYYNDMKIEQLLDKSQDGLVDLAVQSFEENNLKKRVKKEEDYWKDW